MSMPTSLNNYLHRVASYHWYIVLLELFLIGIVVHAAITFLRGTRGARVLKGLLLFLVIAYTIITLFGNDLQRVQYLFKQLLVLTSFAIVVVFQPELRRAMTRLGEARLFRPMTAPARGMVDVLCHSVEYLSHNRIGALIAIERDVGLGGLLDGGTVMNADLSSELLNTIFWPGSVLHDMGVVVRQGKLYSAGVQFPLAESSDVSQELGARHRAAMGLSQESDAVVIVVSEETGVISVAEHGRLLRNLTVEGLNSLLLELLGRHESPALRRHAA